MATQIPKIQIDDILNKTSNVVNLTSEQIADAEIVKANWIAQQSAIEAKAAARQSALAKLAELGLTAEEIAAL